MRSLEGIFIFFARPCLVDRFGRTSLAWASIGLEAHKLDTRTHMPNDEDMPLEAYETPWRTSPSPYKLNDLPLEAKTSPLRVLTSP